MDAAAITALGIIFTGLTGLFLKFVTDNRKSQEERDKIFAKNLEANTKAMKLVAQATQKQAKEAEQRNGHLAEIAVENKQSNYEQSQLILAAISNLPTQHVSRQIVDNQTVFPTLVYFA